MTMRPAGTGTPQQMRAHTAIWASLVVWLICAIAMCINSADLIASFTFRDADDALRLIEVREWLAGQSWFDVTQHRIFPPEGVPMHWSRLVDIPLAGATLLGSLVIPHALAEHVALVVVPLTLFLCLYLTIHALTVEATGRRAMAVMASVMLSLSMGIGIQFLPMRIDHHGWQILLDSLAVLFALRSLSRGALQAGLAGLFMATSLAVAIEGLPLAVAIAGAFALFYLRGRAGRTDFHQLMAYLASLTLSCGALLLGTRGLPGALIGWCDALSPAYLPAMIVASLVLAVGDRLIGAATQQGRLFALGLAGAAGAAAFVLGSPQCLAGPFSALDPVVYRYWYLNVGEGMPAWTQPIDIAIIVPLQGAVGLVGTLFALRFSAPERRDGWLLLLVLQIVTFGVSLVVMRAMGIAHALALPGAAWLFLTAFAGAMSRAIRPLRIVLGLSCFLLTPIGAEAMAYTLIVPDTNGQARDFEDRWAAHFGCTTRASLRGFDALDDALVFAPLDIGPDLLIYTRHSVVATGHHRNRAGMKAVITAFISAPDAARPIVAESGARYVAYCEGQREIKNYSKANPDGLMAQLRQGHVPGWLARVPMPRGQPIQLFRVVDQSS